jgi:radical SAM superfamily enzyme YgiQ (UPF0313 family)
MGREGKIVLFNPSAREFVPFYRLPLALIATSSVVDAEGYNVTIISQDVDPDYQKHVLEEVKDAICFGVTSHTGTQITNGVAMSRLVKEQYPHIPIVWGGVHPSILPGQTCQHPTVDIVVKGGQGEVTFSELIHRLQDDQPLDGLPGIVFKRDGQVIQNPDRRFTDLNALPPWPFHLIDVNRHMEVTRKGNRITNYITSIGCPSRCGFCSEPLTSQRLWKAKTPERTLDEMEWLVRRYGINVFAIDDNNFFTDLRRVRKICEGILDRKLNIRWGRVPGRVDRLIHMSEEDWELLRESGCYQILVGVESGDQEMLDLVYKDTTVEEYVTVQERAQKHGIRLACSFITGMPILPDYKGRLSYEAEFQKSVDLVRQVAKQTRGFHSFNFYVYSPYPGTLLYHHSLKLGLKEPQSLEEWKEFHHRSSLTPPWVTQNQKNFVRYFVIWLELLNRGKLSKTTNPLLLLIYKLVAWITKLRWNHYCFRFPLEAWALREYGLMKYRRLLKKQTANRKAGGTGLIVDNPRIDLYTDEQVLRAQEERAGV